MRTVLLNTGDQLWYEGTAERHMPQSPSEFYHFNGKDDDDDLHSPIWLCCAEALWERPCRGISTDQMVLWFLYSFKEGCKHILIAVQL